MAGYIDFVSRAAEDHALLDSLKQAIPFGDAESLQAWFSTRGYELSTEEAALLYKNQDALLLSEEQINY